MEGRVVNVKEEEFESENAFSDSESVVDVPAERTPEEPEPSSQTVLHQLDSEGSEYITLTQKFHCGIGSLSQYCKVEAAYRAMNRCPINRAQLVAFRLFSRAMSDKRGCPNFAYAWLGTSKDEAERIMKDGFGVSGDSKGPLGYGLHLFSDRGCLDSILSAPVDSDGLRHIVVCKVILGCSEVLSPGSEQSGPSSGDHDSGVDDTRSPLRYVIWYPNVRTHVLPFYTLSVKLDFTSNGVQRGAMRRPTTPFIPFSVLFDALSRSLSPLIIRILRRIHNDYLDRKITRPQLIFRLRRVAGDELIVSAIREFRNEMRTTGSLRAGGD